MLVNDNQILVYMLSPLSNNLPVKTGMVKGLGLVQTLVPILRIQASLGWVQDVIKLISHILSPTPFIIICYWIFFLHMFTFAVDSSNGSNYIYLDRTNNFCFPSPMCCGSVMYVRSNLLFQSL